MSHPNSSHDLENQYPEDAVTHYPQRKTRHHKKESHNKLKTVAEVHNAQMGHIMNLMREHHNAKTRALKKKA